VKWHLSNAIPYWIAGAFPDMASCYSEMLQVVEELAQNGSIIGIGEIGLDKRFGNLELQKRLFISQLDIAQRVKLPVIIHCVGYYYELFELIKRSNLHTIIILHGFKGSIEIFNKFKSLNLFFSLSHRLLDSDKYSEVVKEILVSERFFIESDYPFNGELDEVNVILEAISVKYSYRMDNLKDILIRNQRKLIEERVGTISKK